MGLGKTLQVLAHLDALKKGNDRGEAGPSLIVCPTSLVFNWEAEARQFTPDLRVLSLHGPQRRELFAQIPAQDLIITSYALMRRDAEQYRGMEFDTIVLDEAQHIKNRQTQNAQAVKAAPRPAQDRLDRNPAGEFGAGFVVHLRFPHAGLSGGGPGIPRTL